MINDQTARAITTGHHGAPFDVLGRHAQEGEFVIRAHLAGAEAAWVEDDLGFSRAMEWHHGVLIARGADLPEVYHFRIQGFGSEWRAQDPYRFHPVLGDIDEHLISEGAHHRLWDRLGAHPMHHMGVDGTVFAIWAPNAKRVSVVGGFNHWNATIHPMRLRGATGVWEIFLPDVLEGAAYKYDIIGADGDATPQKADPVGFGSEHPPATASIVRKLPAPAAPNYGHRNRVDQPISIYEVHLGSWRRKVEEDNRRLSYDELAVELVRYVKDMGFTHIELMPISEFPFDGSWGYQPVGLFAPTVRHGTAAEFQAFVTAAQNEGIGVLLDWVPGHFPTDPHGLGWLDGTPLYQYADPREGFHRDWNTLIFDYGRREVRNYLTANALYWLTQYGLDGLRVDAVASMLYRDYSRSAGEWIPNAYGGRENLEAIDFLREMNIHAYGAADGIMTVAEESTSFPGVSAPVHEGGLGFGYKWNMGWMNDTLKYISEEPINRKYHHDKLTFGAVYAFSENFILPISHDEVVHGKGSMIGKMPGNEWEKFANLRAYYGMMWGWPGKKLLFMGCEFGQLREWNHDISLDWHLLDDPRHAGLQYLIRDLNMVYRGTPALHVKDCDAGGFEWIVGDDAGQSVLAFLRRGGPDDAPVLVISNLTPVERSDYQVGVPVAGDWTEILNTDAEIYGGGNRGNMGAVEAAPAPHAGHPASASLTLPPLSTLVLCGPKPTSD